MNDDEEGPGGVSRKEALENARIELNRGGSDRPYLNRPILRRGRAARARAASEAKPAAPEGEVNRQSFWRWFFSLFRR